MSSFNTPVDWLIGKMIIRPIYNQMYIKINKYCVSGIKMKIQFGLHRYTNTVNPDIVTTSKTDHLLIKISVLRHLCFIFQISWYQKILYTIYLDCKSQLLMVQWVVFIHKYYCISKLLPYISISKCIFSIADCKVKVNRYYIQMFEKFLLNIQYYI